MHDRGDAALTRTARISARFFVMFALAMLSCSSVVLARSLSVHNADLTATVTSQGSYRVQWHQTHWTLNGELTEKPSGVFRKSGMDAIGVWQEVAVQIPEGLAVIRVYRNLPVVLFRAQFEKTTKNHGVFPRFTRLPTRTMEFSYRVRAFAPHEFGRLGAEGPWVLFNKKRQTMVLSPADHFLVSAMSVDRHGVDPGGIERKIRTLPAGFEHGTLLVVGRGIVKTIDHWGGALQALNGKAPVSDDADVLLRKFGYWTDHGATYYYKFVHKLGYEGTLRAVRKAYRRLGVPIGYMQLDSWWYPKQKGNSLAAMAVNGETVYRANPKIFTHGLRAFHRQLGLPLAVHARWVAPNSPYRHEYKMSRNVVVSPQFWQRTARYLHRGGVVVYEQDWLNKNARPAINLAGPQEFLGNMAHAMARENIAIQYCMALPGYFLASTRYQNVQTIRVSNDRFERARWNNFLYTSVLAHAVGLWPWSDVFMSRDLPDLILATLSGGPVGVGDALNDIDPGNLRRAMTAESVLLKPDVPIQPLDGSFVRDAEHQVAPMVAATHSGDEVEVFAYPRRKDEQDVSVSLRSLGIVGPAYAWNWVEQAGKRIAANGRLRMAFHNGWAYAVVAPVQRDGIALLGDTHKIVPLAKQQIVATQSTDPLHVEVKFAAGDGDVVLSGYSARRPRVRASSGRIGVLHYSDTTHLFRFSVRRSTSRAHTSTAKLTISDS